MVSGVQAWTRGVVFRKVGMIMIRFAPFLLLPLLLTSSGCRLLALFADPPTKDVPAEYPYLADKRVCIVVRTDDEIEFTYPDVRWETADHVRVALEGKVLGVDVVGPRKVVDFQRKESDWDSMDPARIGKRFDAERVLEIDLTQYTTREPESPHLYRGHISAAVRVYNTDFPGRDAAWQAEVRTIYPPEGPGAWGTTDRDIRAATLAAFAQDVAGKFYDRKVKVE